MAEAKAKVAKEKAAPRPKKAGPSISDLVVEAVSASKKRSGMSLHVVKKALAAGGYDVDKNKFRVTTAIKRLVAKGTLVRVKGIGAQGSFKINKNKAEVKAKQPAKTPLDLLSGKQEYPEDRQEQEHSFKDGDSPFPVVWEVLNGLLWRRPISPSSSSADKEEEDSLPAPTIEILFTPAMDQGQQTFLAETVVYIKEEPEDFEFEGCGDIPLPSQPGQNHTKTNTSASQPGQNRRFKRVSNFTNHPKHHGGEKPYSCSFCGKQFIYSKSCRTHERKYHVANTKTKIIASREFTCNFCEMSFLKSRKLLQHQKKCKPRHVPPTEFTCNICGRRFKRVSSLTCHRRQHSGEKPYSCSFCGKRFAFGKSCRTHERKYHVAMGYRCSDCGETFREREQKDRHKCLVFKGETVFPCTECTEVFSRRYLLKKHQLKFHPEIFHPEIFPCTECTEVFSRRYLLEKHHREQRCRTFFEPRSTSRELPPQILPTLG